MASKPTPISKFDRREITRLIEMMNDRKSDPKNGRFPKPIRKQMRKLPQIEELFQQMLAHPDFGDYGDGSQRAA